MAITNAFREAVASKNALRVRIMMKDSLLVDPTFKEFEEMARLAGDIYEKHDGGELSDDTSKWTTDYMNRLMVELVENFSRERIIHLKRVVRYLYPAPTPTTAPQAPQSTGNQASQNSGQWSHTRSGENVYRPKNYNKEKAKDEEEGNVTRVAKSALKGAGFGGFCGAAALFGAYGPLVNAVTTAAANGTQVAIGGAAAGAILSGAFVGAIAMGGACLLSDNGGR